MFDRRTLEIVVQNYLLSGWLAIALITLAGCNREETPRFVSAPQLKNLPVDLQTAVQDELRKRTGTFERPRLLSDPDRALSTLKLGQRVYQDRCVQCHGLTGDGNGPAAAVMYPRPRDYTKGVFKFTSTPFGSKPVRADLIKTVTSGVRGTSMPGFSLLPKEEIEAVVDYVMVLSQRGELEQQMIVIAVDEEELDPEIVEEELFPVVVGRWRDAEGQQVVPLSPQPVFTLEHVRRGKEAFLSRGCSKCHGEDGRGQTPENLAGDLKDTWGHATRAADLTSGMLRGGQRPMDIYHRIYSGINGTPMPGFANAFQDQPEGMWDLVAYVLSVSNRRRLGERPAPGKISPYVPVAPTGDAGAHGPSAE